MSLLHFKDVDFLHKGYANSSTAALGAEAQTLAVTGQCWNFAHEVCFRIRCLKTGHCARVPQILDWR